MELNGVPIDNTFAEGFPIWVSRVIITGVTRDWAMTAAMEATGFATSAIGCPCEAGIEGYVSADETPDGRPGVSILICASKKKVPEQVMERIAECVLTAATTSVFNGMPDAEEKFDIKIHFFGDKFESKVEVGGRQCWKIPIMEGDYVGEEVFGMVKGVAGGNFFVMADNQMTALMGAKAAADAILEVKGTITSFAGGIVASGSKVGAKNYKFPIPATTNEQYCPAIRDKVPDTKVPEGVKSIYEIVINGVDEAAVKKAMAAGIKAAVKVPGVSFISAGNYEGKLGPFQFKLAELF